MLLINDERDETSEGERELNGNPGEYAVALSEGGDVELEGIEQ